MFSGCLQDFSRMFSGCSDGSYWPGGIWWSFQMKVWTLKIQRNLMIPNYSMIPAAAIRWSPGIRWSPAIRWSIRSMDFDNRKVYGDTSITDGLVYIYRVFFLTGPQGPGNFQGPELLAAPGIFQGAWKFSGPGNFQAPWKIPGSWIFPGPLENSRGVLISGQTRCDVGSTNFAPSRKNVWAPKRPFLPQNRHFWPFWGKYRPCPLIWCYAGFGARATLTIYKASTYFTWLERLTAQPWWYNVCGLWSQSGTVWQNAFLWLFTVPQKLLPTPCIKN